MSAAPRFAQVAVETLILSQKTEAALRAGEALLIAEGIERPKLFEIVFALIVEASATLRAMPDKERTWLSSCDRSGWPSMVQDPQDAREAFAVLAERVRLGEESAEALSSRRDKPSAQAIDRVWLVTDWRRLLVGKNRIRDWRILWLLADGRVTAKKIAARSHCSARTIYNVKELQTLAISTGLRSLLSEVSGKESAL